MAEQSLKDKTVKGVKWSAIDNLAQYIVSFVVSVILARLLSPGAYGLIGLTAIFTGICTEIIEGGFKDALIRKSKPTELDYSTVFIVNLLISIVLYVLICFCAPLIASFFGRTELIALVRVTSLGLIIGAFGIVQKARLTKAIEFKTQTKVTITASLLSGTIGITMALLGYGVWSLVAQGLSSQLFRTVFLWIYNKWKPSIQFSTSSFRELFSFGWKMMASGVLNSVWRELYQVVVGKFYSAETLGQYTRAKGFSQLLSSNLTSVVQRVTYPVLSHIQEDSSRLYSVYRRLIRVTMFITAMSSLFLGAVSEPLIHFLIGPKWHDAAIYLPLICISSSLYPLQSLNLNILEVKGRSDLFLVLEIIKKVLFIVPLFVGAYVGIMPMLYVNIIISIVCFFLNSHYSGSFLGYSTWQQIRDIIPSYIVALFVSLPVYFLKYLPLPNLAVLALQLAVGCFLTIAICRSVKLEEYSEILTILKPYLKKIKSFFAK